MSANVSRKYHWVAATVVATCLAGIIIAVPHVLPYFIFRPTRLAVVDPRVWGLKDAELVTFRSKAGARLVAWWLAPRNPAAPVVLLAHGRSANISTRASIANRLFQDGFGVLLFDYSGYGASSGRPSEDGLNQDADTAYEWLTSHGITPSRVIVLGQSLGDAPATYLAANNPVGGLVLVSPFTSLPDAAVDRLPWLPLRSLPWRRNRFDVASYFHHVIAPTLFIASAADGLVPLANSQKLAEQHDGRVIWIEEDRLHHNGLLTGVTLSGRLTPALRALMRR